MTAKRSPAYRVNSGFFGSETYYLTLAAAKRSSASKIVNVNTGATWERSGGKWRKTK